MEKIARPLVIIAVAVAIFILGSRFTTLKFGQVFPAQHPDDQKRIVQLEQQVRSLEEQIQDAGRLASEVEDIRGQRDELRAEVEELRSYVANLQASTETVEVTEENVDPDESIVRRGDPSSVVRRVFGRPSSISSIGNTEFWDYNQYGVLCQVQFKNGKVSEWHDMPIEP